MFLYNFLTFFHAYYMLILNKGTYLSLLFKIILSKNWSSSLWGSDILLFWEFMNIVSILFYNFIEFIILLYTFLVFSFAQYKKYMVWRISFSKFSDVLSVFYLWNIYWYSLKHFLEVNILSYFSWVALKLASDA